MNFSYVKNRVEWFGNFDDGVHGQNSSREDWSYGRERYRRAAKKTGLTEGPLEENLSLVAVLDVEIQKSI